MTRVFTEEQKERNRQRSVEWRKNNKERHFIAYKCWVEENREKKRIIDNKWRLNNKEYFRERLKIPQHRIASNLRGRVYIALKGAKKSDTTEKLLGCTIEEFMQYLEKQFSPGMTWDNYGKWHVDHIRPCASFDLVVPAQQEICFHYTNMQPLWAIDNLRKSAKYIS